jgi:hypothetical protein
MASGARSTLPEASAETVSTTAASANATTSSDKATLPRSATRKPIVESRRADSNR